MTDIASFSADLGLEEAAVRRVLEPEPGWAGSAAPWYVIVLLGVGAWITALIMIVFIGVLLHLTFDVDEPGLGSAAIGAIMFVCGLLIQVKAKAGVFAEQFAIALAAAGAVIAAGSVGVEAESLWTAAATAAAMTAIDIWRGRNAQQRFLLAALAAGLGIAALSEEMIPYRVDIIALALPIGTLLYLRPYRKDLRPTATTLLLAMPFYALVMDHLHISSDGSAGWVPRSIALATMLALAWLHPPAGPIAQVRYLFIAAIAAAVCLLLPPGGSAALAIMMLAFVLGHWPLAIVGMLLEIYVVPRFYYDLELSLLTKSWIMMAVGALLLVSYAVLRRSDGAST